MPEPHEELLEIAGRLERLATEREEPRVEKPLTALEDAANTIGKAWSGSWLGYHSSTYYDSLKSPPPGAHFSQEWGYTHTTGTWIEFDTDEMDKTIRQLAETPNIEHAMLVSLLRRRLKHSTVTSPKSFPCSVLKI
jgi:hypothetical protein